MNFTVDILDRSAGYLNVDAKLEALDASGRFTEGPVWHRDGFYLFSDIPANVIYKIVPGEKKRAVHSKQRL